MKPSMLRSLLEQLLLQRSAIPPVLDALMSPCINMHRHPPTQTLMEMLRQAVLEFQEVFIVLDALDECTGGSDLVKVLTTVNDWQTDCLRLLVTSRVGGYIRKF